MGFLFKDDTNLNKQNVIEVFKDWTKCAFMEIEKL